MGNIITPTIGRKVHYYPAPGEYPDLVIYGGSKDGSEPLDANVVYVWGDRLVNLAGYDHAGNPFAATSITLMQPGDDVPQCSHARWMPYQMGQAERTQEAERKVAAAEVSGD